MSSRYEALQEKRYPIIFNPDDGGYMKDSSIDLSLPDKEKVLAKASQRNQIKAFLNDEGERFELVGFKYDCAIPNPSTGKVFLQVALLGVYKTEDSHLYSVRHNKFSNSVTEMSVSKDDPHLHFYQQHVIELARKEIQESKNSIIYKVRTFLKRKKD